MILQVFGVIFVETPTFWCLHVDPTACTNFSPQTVERRQPESREILIFPFLLSPFPPFPLYEPFPFLFLFSFPFFHFCFSILFSFLISFSPHFLLSFGHFLSLFGATTHSVKRRKFPPHFLNPFVWLSIFHPFSFIS